MNGCQIIQRLPLGGRKAGRRLFVRRELDQWLASARDQNRLPQADFLPQAGRVGLGFIGGNRSHSGKFEFQVDQVNQMSLPAEG
jgi:hypothetical protein